MHGANPQGPQNRGCPSTLEGALRKWELGHPASILASPFSSVHFVPCPPLAFSPPRAFLRTFYSELLLSPSLFQFDGESAYVGMSDGNPELLSTSQVGAPSFLSGQLALG